MQKFEFDDLIKRADIFCRSLEEWLFNDTREFTAECCVTVDPVPVSERMNGEFRPVKVGDRWGNAWDSAWFHLTASVPGEWDGKPLAVRLFTGGEILLCDAAGEPLCGLTNSSVYAHNYSKDLYFIPGTAKGGRKLEFWAECAANGLFGIPLNGMLEKGKQPRTYDTTVRSMYFGVFNHDVYQLRYDIDMLLSLARTYGHGQYPANRIIRTIADAINIYKADPANAAAARQELRKYYDLPLGGNTLTAVAVGHAHIDTGWLWPVRETIRKCARTFSSQIGLMERYPDFVFGASQAQHYEFVKEHYPSLFEKIREKVKTGQWEVQGGMWVEADGNVTGGESFVRQFLYGKNFYKDEFGVDVKNLWLPDVFGYSAALPQIIRKAGCDFFVTQKMSWNKVNTFPHNTFRWRGIDGSEVITHFPPENNYNSDLSPALLNAGVKNFVESDYIDSFLSLFGIGNGGGGPCELHIEQGRRLAHLNGCPQVKFGRADEFLEGLRKYHDRLPMWVGELYLEMHRGTLTTQAKVKKGNRMLENALRKVEAVYSALPFGQYPAAELSGLWKKLLINQFHDILPGSSIAEVYDVTRAEHAAALKKCGELLAAAGKTILQEDADSVTYFNATSYDYNRVLALPAGWTGINEGVAQLENGGAVVQIKVPALSSLTLTRGARAVTVEAASGLTLENELVRYEFGAAGKLLNAYDKETGRTIGTGGNDFTLYDDHPNQYDAWDIEHFYKDIPVAEPAPVKAEKFTGPVRQEIRLELRIGGSAISQSIYLAKDSKRLDFVTEVDWQECHKMLRVAFPVNVCTNESAGDIQYGYLKRPTHSNTSWEMACFEMVAHRYADLSDAQYGVALLNDCKYGYKLKDNVLDLNLLRSPRYPDDSADIGRHSFTYSLLPHCGTLVESDVMAEATALNMPPVVWTGMTGAVEMPCRLTGSGVSLEVMKKAEKSDCLVLRLVETDGCESTASLSFTKEVELQETDLLEWNALGEKRFGTAFELCFKPFEIKTFKVKVR